MLELASIIILGISAQWIAWKIKVPAILPLILLGLAVGPLSTLITEDGAKLINPIYDAERGEGLFPGRSLFYFVSLAIGIILFEGGLTLKRKEIAVVGPAILKLITYGSLITFLFSGLAAHFIMQLSWSISFLFAGLIIVTGPTVIAPILQNIPLTRNVSTVLKWEGILIDPIGALVAVLVFEFIQSSDGGMVYTSHAFITFSKIILIGAALGAMAGAALYYIIKYDMVPHYLMNVFTLAFVLCVFVFSDILAHESGLLAVVVMGTVMANLEVPRLKEILSFKESISVLLISVLFILLSANINMSELELLAENWRPIALFGVVALVIRPVGVFLSTRQSELSFNEKLFIGWVGPRGIVAAGIASLFGITLSDQGVAGAEFITPLVFMIVLGTVLLNATTARMVAKLLGVIQSDSTGVLIIGANAAARLVGNFLHETGRHVVLIDSNEKSVERALKADLEAYVVNIYNDDLSEQFELIDMGHMLAMTASHDVNMYALERYRSIFGEKSAYRLLSADEMNLPLEQRTEDYIFQHQDDYLNLNEVVRDYPQIHEVKIRSLDRLHAVLETLFSEKQSIPLFLENEDGVFQPIPAELDGLKEKEVEIRALIYMGKPMHGEEEE